MSLPRTVLMLAMMALLAFAPPQVHAAEKEDHTIVLHHMELESIDATLRVGETVAFHNLSDMAHNLYITYSDGTIDNLDTQFPGMKRWVKLRVPGPAMVQCWIHPIIKAEIEILEKADE